MQILDVLKCEFRGIPNTLLKEGALDHRAISSNSLRLGTCRKSHVDACIAKVFHVFSVIFRIVKSAALIVAPLHHKVKTGGELNSTPNTTAVWPLYL